MKHRYLIFLSVTVLGVGLLAGCQNNASDQNASVSSAETETGDTLTEEQETENTDASTEEEQESEPVSAESLNLKDGTYTVEVAMTGGSGRASVDSPAELTVQDGVCTARIVWSSPYYDYMLIGEEKYLPVNTEGNSAFEIPVEIFDGAVEVTADTTAMSEPHEIDYILQFDSTSLQKQ